MEPVPTPLEPVDVTATRRDAWSDAEALITAAWAAHHAELYGFLVHATREPAVAEDLLADAFLRLTREVRAGRAPDNVRAWLYRVAANLATSRGRRIAVSMRGLTRLGARRADPPDDPVGNGYLGRESRSELVAALEGLRPDARTALLLSAEGFSGAEIAAAIGRTEAATRTLLCRTRLSVRSHLEPRKVTP
jgi:RNA polymerase sigma-70 factor (ECF subfamily)